MNMGHPCAVHYEPYDPSSFMFSTTTSSAPQSHSPSPSPPSAGVLEHVIGAFNPYGAPRRYDAPVYDPPSQPPTAYFQPSEHHITGHHMYEHSYATISPPELHISTAMTLVGQQAIPHLPTEYHMHQETSPAQISLPGPSQLPPVDLPKRKGDRALARLHRSAMDPDRHWACTHCIQKFARKSDLTRHLKRHAGLKEYPCTAPSCPLPPEERGFFRADARRRHWSKSPSCEIAFYKTPEGVAWCKKNGNRRGVHIIRDESEEPSDTSESQYAE